MDYNNHCEWSWCILFSISLFVEFLNRIVDVHICVMYLAVSLTKRSNSRRQHRRIFTDEDSRILRFEVAVATTRRIAFFDFWLIVLWFFPYWKWMNLHQRNWKRKEEEGDASLIHGRQELLFLKAHSWSIIQVERSEILWTFWEPLRRYWSLN